MLPTVRGTLEDRLGKSRREVRGAFRGTRDQVDAGTRAVVIGGGIAGISAACVLAERGVQVTLLEKETRLGGRMRSLPQTLHGADGNMPYEMGAFTAFYRHYYNVRGLLRRIDPELTVLRALDDFSVLGPNGSIESFTNLPSAAPLNVLALMRRTPFLSLQDLRKLSTERTRQLLAFDPTKHFAIHDGMSARQFLDELGLPPHAREMLFRVFTHAVFNDESSLSASEMLASLHFYFLGNPEGMLFDVLEEPANDALFVRMERYLKGLGVDIQLGVQATEIVREKGDFLRIARSRGESLPASGLVMAQHAQGLRSLVEKSPDLNSDQGFVNSIRELQSSPSYVVWRLFFDKPTLDVRKPFVSVAGLGSLDTITIQDRLEGESRRYAMRTGGSVVQLQSFALPNSLADDVIKQDLIGTLRSLYPELAEARVVGESYVRRDDCPAFAPGSYAQRPKVATPYGNVALAGDFVRVPFPCALMERATASGFLAANMLLDRWDVRGESLYMIPPRGFMSSMIR